MSKRFVVVSIKKKSSANISFRPYWIYFTNKILESTKQNASYVFYDTIPSVNKASINTDDKSDSSQYLIHINMSTISYCNSLSIKLAY
jgi:hypothetical protein